jgi:hypothetical protein
MFKRKSGCDFLVCRMKWVFANIEEVAICWTKRGQIIVGEQLGFFRHVLSR